MIFHHRAGRTSRPETTSIRSSKVALLPDVPELWNYRYMTGALVRRDIKVRFSQTVLGILWYVLQPFLLMVVITIGFRFVFPADVNGLPYPLFVASGLIIWLYFANALNSGASCFERFQGIVTKIYIPNLALPLASIIASLADLLAASLLLGPLMLYYQSMPSWRVILIPVIVSGLMLWVCGLVLVLSVACAKYKDLRAVLPLVTQVLFFASPVFVSDRMLSGGAKFLFGINPLAGYIDAFRWAIFAKAQPPDLAGVILAGAATVGLFFAGLLYFQRFHGDVLDIV